MGRLGSVTQLDSFSFNHWKFELSKNLMSLLTSPPQFWRLSAPCIFQSNILCLSRNLAVCNQGKLSANLALRDMV